MPWFVAEASDAIHHTHHQRKQEFQWEANVRCSRWVRRLQRPRVPFDIGDHLAELHVVQQRIIGEHLEIHRQSTEIAFHTRVPEKLNRFSRSDSERIQRHADHTVQAATRRQRDRQHILPQPGLQHETVVRDRGKERRCRRYVVERNEEAMREVPRVPVDPVLQRAEEALQHKDARIGVHGADQHQPGKERPRVESDQPERLPHADPHPA